jgi:predicted DNA-binding transcriptional regulator YafY
MEPHSHRGDLTARLVELQLLLTGNAPSQRELIKYFGVDRKTIKRAIDALSLHYQIVEEQDGREVRYRFSDDYKFTPPALTPEELATLLLAQESIAATGLTAFGSPFAEHARRLLAKVRASLPTPLRGKLDSLATVFGNAAISAKDFAPHAATIDRLADAAVEGRRLRLSYHSLTDDRIKDRLVDPYCVYFDPDGATLKLAAYDYLRHDIIPFSIDRIRALHDTDERFTRPPNFNLHDYLTQNCFNGIHGAPLTVRLRAHGTTARVFRERTFHPSQRIVKDTRDTVTIEMHVARGRGLIRFILSWSPDIEVIAPEDLQSEITDTLTLALTRSSNNTAK